MKTFLTARWHDLIMANYEVPNQVLTPFLPRGVVLDQYYNTTLVSLVGFMFKDSKIFGVPIPFMGTFEEINLRFYVKRVDETGTKRGVVFIGETVPFKPVAWLANTLYKEHYSCVPTRHQISVKDGERLIQYDWKKNGKWNGISVKAKEETANLKEGSIEEFIFEHYYGYTRSSAEVSQEYRVNHRAWRTHEIAECCISCDFGAMYGKEFAFLNEMKAHSVIMAEGSDVSIDWKRIKF